MYTDGDKFSMYRFAKRTIKQRYSRKNKRFKFISHYISGFRQFGFRYRNRNTIYDSYISNNNKDRILMSDIDIINCRKCSFTEFANNISDINSDDYYPNSHIVTRRLLQLEEIDNDIIDNY